VGGEGEAPKEKNVGGKVHRGFARRREKKNGNFDP